ncbi:hypothetical protein ALP20_200128 [Pseudomonas coronafaciens pv. coronafaciens]|nr:hypothetical protein ALP20_200128 [Pseudomonas coronafaciens pv. coronafaciens]
MGQAPGKLPHCLHLLRLPQLLFGSHQFFSALGNALLQCFIKHTQICYRPVTLCFQGAALFQVYQNTRQTKRRSVLSPVNPAIGLDPIVITVRAANTILMYVGAATRYHLCNSCSNTRSVIRVYGGQDLRLCQPLPTYCLIQSKGLGKGLINGEIITDKVPVPRADNGTGRKC